MPANKTITLDLDVKIGDQTRNALSVLQEMNDEMDNMSQNTVLDIFSNHIAAIRREYNGLTTLMGLGKDTSLSERSLREMLSYLPEAYSAYQSYKENPNEQNAMNLIRRSSIFQAIDTNSRSKALDNKYFNITNAGNIAKTIIEPFVQTLLSSFENADLSTIVTRMSQDKAYTRSLEKFGYNLAEEQVREFTEATIRRYTKYGASLDQAKIIQDAYRKAGIQQNNRPLFAQDLMPNEKFVMAYNSYARHPDLSRQRQTSANVRTVNALRNYLEQTGDMRYLAPVLRQVGLLGIDDLRLSEKSSRYTMSDVNDITQAQLDQLAGLVTQRYSNAKRSGAIWASDPTALDNADMVLGRNGKKVQAFQRIIDFLGRFDEITPYVDPSFVAPNQGKVVLNNQAVQQGRTLDQYYIPKTEIDPVTGRLMHRSFAWRKDPRRGVAERESDQFVGIAESELTHILGMHGDGSYGLGMNADGSYKTGAPRMIRVNMNGLFDSTDDGYRYKITDDLVRRQRYMDLLDSKKSFRYQWGEDPSEFEEYVYAMQGDEDVIMIPKRIRDALDAKAKEQHLPSLFDYGNYTGLIDPNDRSKSIKQINNLRKLNSSGTYFEDLYGKNDRLHDVGAFVNLGAFYELIGANKDSGMRLDGQAWGLPEIFQVSQQMRFAHGTDKFYMSALDWRPMLKALAENYRKGKLPGLVANSPMFGPNGEVYLPTTDNLDVLRQFMTGKDSQGKNLDKATLDFLRDMYFVNATDENLPFLIDQTGMKSLNDFREMSLEDYVFHFSGSEPLARKQGRVSEDNKVQLNAAERAQMIMRYGEFASQGKAPFITMRTEEEMSTRKDVIPESLARSIHAGREIREKSEKLYNQRFEELQTLEGRIKFFQGNAEAKKEIERDPLWVWRNLSANRQIAKEISSLEYARARGDLLFEGNTSGRYSQVAEATPGVIPEALLYALNYVSGRDNITDLSLMPDEWKQFMPSVMDEQNMVYAPGIKQGILDLLTRFPSTAGTYLADVTNGAVTWNPDKQTFEIDPEYEARMLELGRNPRDVLSILSTPKQLYQMNTGDFDGDTINAFFGLPDSAVGEAKEYLKRYQEAMQERLAAQRGRMDTPAEKIPSGSEVEEKANSLLFGKNSKTDMALSSAVIRKMEANRADRDTMMEIIKAVEAYDIATSKGKTEGAQIDTKSLALTQQGATYERFLKTLKDASNADDIEGATAEANIFSTSLPSMFDTQGLLALRLRQIGKENGGHIDASSYKSLENWFATRYDNPDSSTEAAAARWYLDMYEKTAIGGHVYSLNELDEGLKFLRDWSLDISNRRKINAPGVEDEYKRMVSFEKRLEEMRTWGMSKEKIKESAEIYRDLAAQNGNDPIYAGYAKLFEDVLASSAAPSSQEYTEKIYAEAQAEIRKENQQSVEALKREASSGEGRWKLQSHYIERANALRNGESLNAGERYPYAWSSLKHWIGDDSTLTINGLTSRDLATGAVTPVPERKIDYNTYSSRKEMLASILDRTYNSADENIATHIGNLMHGSLESFWKMRATNPSFTPEQSLQELKSKFLAPVEAMGEDSAIGQLRKLGVTFSDENGTLVAHNYRNMLTGSQLQAIQRKLDSMFGVPDANGNRPKGTYEQLLDYLTTGHKTIAFEGNNIDEQGNIQEMPAVYRHIYYDKDGKVVRSETSLSADDASQANQAIGETMRTYQTHLLPDLELTEDSSGKIKGVILAEQQKVFLKAVII